MEGAAGANSFRAPMKLRKRPKLTTSPDVLFHQLRKQAEQVEKWVPADEATEAYRIRETEAERNVILGECDRLGLIMYEVSCVRLQ